MLKIALPALILLLLAVFFRPTPGEYPRLILTAEGVGEIRNEFGSVPLFDASLAKVKEDVDAEMAVGIDVPVPKDFSGGYTHERHKRNYLMALQAGQLYQILGEERYAQYVRDMLFEYEAMYSGLPLHPMERSYARGKLFWQCLNESVWLVYMAQAYDTIYTWLPAADRERLENNLFRVVADFISVENPQFYNRIHNHSTWGNAAVGMIALAMDDDELLQRALYGLTDDGLELGVKDDDGGFIKVAGQKAGFLANLEDPFSPDGYYTEGPYYQRYAMYPFLVFGIALHNVKPELKALQYKENVLLKAVDALLSLTDSDGEFFPLNDAQKGMSYHSAELVTAVNIAYHYGGQNPQLLSVAEAQGQVLLDQAGLSVAMGIAAGKAEPFIKTSVNLSDGPQGQKGGVAVLRAGREDLTVVFKYAAQGLSHGHYDKLSFSMFDKGEEVLQDYGLVRFVNIGQKGGGNYLPENASWAKQSIAHNTLVVNETSHFGGDYETGSQHHSELHFFDAGNENIQIVSASESNAYPGTRKLRTLALIKNEKFREPFLLDLWKVDADVEQQYDLPYYYLGQLLETNFAYSNPRVLEPLGESSGYQHLYLEAQGESETGNAKFSWLGPNGFYSLTATTEADDQLLMARVGANDPDFNLRRDPVLILRRPATAGTVFATIIEPHGSYSPVSELALESRTAVEQLAIVYDDDNYTAISIADINGYSSLFVLATQSSSEDEQHSVVIDGKTWSWQGPYRYFEQGGSIQK
ncbi:alginate lyase family protein [Halioglobus maricola]|uniref:Alginate lyase family protein n=2 Tax=Halioglobus maricola TaxID=2601894 RepID=A0A5P9NR01_9GAMM|nr:alginate lyase family protein [Halioglobus maricola]